MEVRGQPTRSGRETIVWTLLSYHSSLLGQWLRHQKADSAQPQGWIPESLSQTVVGKRGARQESSFTFTDGVSRLGASGSAATAQKKPQSAGGHNNG